jgi:hypothetical protein
MLQVSDELRLNRICVPRPHQHGIPSQLHALRSHLQLPLILSPLAVPSLLAKFGFALQPLLLHQLAKQLTMPLSGPSGFLRQTLQRLHLSTWSLSSFTVRTRREAS